MALNEIYKDGNELVLPVEQSTASGDLVQVGALVGLAQKDAWAGEDGNYYTTVKLNGVVKVLGDGNLSVGDAAYRNSGTGVLSNDDSDKFVGHVVATIEADQYVYVRLTQAA